MNTKLSAEVAQDLELQGYAVVADIGGQKKTKYWTPDGREVFAIPSIRTYVRRDAQKKVISEGTRDANLDNGWLTSPPPDPKIRCFTCDKWHDTEKELENCRKSREVFDAKHMKKAKEMVKAQDGEVGDLKTEMNGLKEEVVQLKDMLKTFLESK